MNVERRGIMPEETAVDGREAGGHPPTSPCATGLVRLRVLSAARGYPQAYPRILGRPDYPIAPMARPGFGEGGR